MKQFTFGPDFQRSLLRLIMVDESFCHHVMRYVRPSFFTTRPHGWAFKQMQAYFEEYSRRMTEMPLRAAGQREPGYAHEVEAIIGLGGSIVEEDFIKAELAEFIRRNIFASAHERSQELYNAGQHIKAYDLMCESMDDLRMVTFEQPDRSWFFDSLPERMERRYDYKADPTAGVLPTGCEPMDDDMDGGPKIGELHLVIAPPKIGKTLWLIDKAFVNARLSRAKTLYYNLEGSTQLIEDRLDACFSTELYAAVRKGEIGASLYREMVEEYKELRGLVVIRTDNSWDVSILNITSELNDLKAERGFVPQSIILDYQDLMRSRNGGSLSETQHQTDSMKDLKRLSTQGYCIWTACASQRPKEGDEDTPHIIKASSIASAFDKVRVADGYGSLNSTRDEKAAGIWRYYFEEYRAAPMGKVYRLKNDAGRMRVGLTVERVKYEPKVRKERKPAKAGSGKVASGPGTSGP
jgi:replicative DNA helicase